MERRQFITMAVGGLTVALLSPIFRTAKVLAAKTVEKLSKSNEEWKKLLTPAQYNVLRKEDTEDTERPFTSPLLGEHREGVFACVACDLPLFPSKFKFDGGTGWPSFFDSIPGHIETKNDYALIMARTEYHCARCGGHHGHVFEDGPKPTGLRYCNNGVALKFIPKEA
jgi:peptide-methionine (R)-S-oxide reductase